MVKKPAARQIVGGLYRAMEHMIRTKNVRFVAQHNERDWGLLEDRRSRGP